MSIVVEFYAVDPDVVELAGSGGADPDRLTAALTAARAAATAKLGGNGPIDTWPSAPSAAEALAELTRHRGRLVGDVNVNALAAGVLFDLLAAAAIELNLDQETLQGVALREEQAQGLIAAGATGDEVGEALAAAVAEASGEAQHLGGALVMLLG